jgi:gliding motility-associated-like protein
MYRVKHIYILVFMLFLFMHNVKAQTCSVLVSSDTICLGNTVFYSVSVSGGTPVSFSWNFGDGNTATLPIVSHTYAAIGLYNASVSVSFAGGATCTAQSVGVRVVHLPEVNFSVTTADTVCYFQNLLTIIDSSKSGLSGSPLTQRVFQLNNGFLQIDTPPFNRVINYTNSSDIFGWSYNVLIEVTDKNGCVNKKELTNVSYLRPQLPVPDFILDIDKKCDSTSVVFFNTIPIKPNVVTRFVWDFGNGKMDSVNWAIAQQTYRATSLATAIYSPRLTFYDNFGCSQTNFITKFVIPVYLDSTFEFTIQGRPLTTRCFNGGGEFLFKNNSTVDGIYRIYQDSILLDTFIAQRGFPFDPTLVYKFPNCGKYRITYEVAYETCSLFVDTNVHIFGPRVIFEDEDTKILGRYQCEIHDSVYFTPPGNYLSCHYQNGGMKWLWDFGDPFAAPCTTDTRNGINVGLNCNFSKDSSGVSHRYSDGREGCYTTKLTIIDTTTGCIDVGSIQISLLPPNAGAVSPLRGLKWEHEYRDKDSSKLCPFDRFRFLFDELYPKCGIEEGWLQFDSACGGKWHRIDSLKKIDYIHFYSNQCDTTGVIKVGLITRGGKNRNGDYCYDTVYYPMFFMIPKNPDFTFRIQKNCPTYEVEITPNSIFHYGNFAVYFGLVDTDSLLVLDNTYTIPSPIILRTNRSGLFPINGVRMSVVDSLGCSLLFGYPIGLGTERKMKSNKPSYCVGDTVIISSDINYIYYTIDSIPERYWEDSARAAEGKETVWWDMGDGKGFVHQGPVVNYTYDKPGAYTIRMLYKDSLTCYDTLIIEKFIKVVKPKAKIYTEFPELTCAPQITSFADSTYFIDSLGNRITRPEPIVGWQWNIGGLSTASTLNRPFFSFPQNKTYTVRLIAKSQSGCYDTAYQQINIRGPLPKLSVTDTLGCAPFTAQFKNESVRKSVVWRYFFGDKDSTILNKINDSDTYFTYNEQGIYHVRLLAIDTIVNPITGNFFECRAFFPDSLDPEFKPLKIYVFEVPSIEITSKDTVCPNELFDLITIADTAYRQFTWSFGDGNSNTTNRPDTFITHIYTSKGNYFIEVIPSSNLPLVCLDTARKLVVVTDVEAKFDIDESKAPTFNFINKSTNAVRYEWYDKLTPDLGSNPFSTAFNATYKYEGDSIQFNICLAAYSVEDCWDTTCKSIYYLSKIKIPNVFTPANGDGLNDAFDIDIVGFTQYDLKIYNRWGSLVFESNTDGNGNDGNNWNGKIQNTGEDCAAGVYYYIFNYKLVTRQEIQSVNGTVTLIR